MRKLLVGLLMLLTINIYSQETVKLDTVVLSGIRADEKTPVTQKTITRSDIQKTYSGQELSVILDKTPSITSNTDGGHPQGYTYFRLRGIDQTRINMTLNGVPLNEPEDQGVYFSNYPNFAKNIKSMQIQRGVGTSTNGVSSFAGSINFVTPFGVKEKTELELEYGSYNTSRLNFTHETGLFGNNRFSSYLNVSKFNTDGYKYHSGSEGFSTFLSFAWYGDTETLKFTGFTGKSNNQMAWFAVSEDDIKTDPRTNYNSPDADDNFSQSLVMLEYKNRLNSQNKFSTTIFYNRLDGEWDLYVGDMLNFGLSSNFFGIIGNYNYTPDTYDINIGMSANGYNRNHSMVILPNENVDIYNNIGYKNEYSTYFKVKHDIDVLTLFADVQYRYVTFRYNGDVDLQAKDWSFFNPKIGFTFTLDEKTSFYSSIGKSHREPTRSDMFGGEDNLVEFINVTPEEVLDYELGINYKSENLVLQGNFYYMDFDNEITLLGSLGSYSLQQFGNVEQSYRAGLELDFTWKVHEDVTFKYNGNFSDNQISDQGIEFEPLYTPKVINNFAVNMHKDDFFVEISAKHHSKSYLDFANENVTPSFIVTNMIMGVDRTKYAVNLSVLNILGVDYFTNGYMDGGVRNFYVNAPTSVYLTVKYKF